MATQQEHCKDTCEKKFIFGLQEQELGHSKAHVKEKLPSWILFHVLWVSPPSLPPIEVILANIVCFAQGMQVSFDLPEHWQGAELHHYIKFILCN